MDQETMDRNRKMLKYLGAADIVICAVLLLMWFYMCKTEILVDWYKVDTQRRIAEIICCIIPPAMLVGLFAVLVRSLFTGKDPKGWILEVMRILNPRLRIFYK
ncbi:MAG: hypothetical protein CEN90_232 [Parcubacteria group bacterium Licking1014_17]|nr:MAG: hypothetical protein CEN90_232 [Parcubacteria group bacterium Licking1014_17]